MPYGKIFLESLPWYRVTSELGDGEVLVGVEADRLDLGRVEGGF
jgi:hypothetical protein